MLDKLHKKCVIHWLFAILYTIAAPVQMSNQLGLEGWCPVEIHESTSPKPNWKKGQDEFSTVYDGITYRFANEGNQEKFLASPETFVPAMGGLCTVCAAASEPIYKYGKVNYTVRYNGRLFLFPSVQTKLRFLDDKRRYDEFDIAYNGACLVSQKDGESKKGKKNIFVIHNHLRFFFSSLENKKRFVESPEEFMPKN